MDGSNTFSRWQWLKELLITIVAGEIPRKPGILLRRLLYRATPMRLGRTVSIERGVEFFGTRQIEIGNHAFIDRNVRLQAAHPNCRLEIGEHAFIEQSVCLQAAYPNCRIELGHAVILADSVTLKGGGANSQILVHDQVKLDRGVDVSGYANGCIEIGQTTYIGPYGCLAGPNIKIGRDCLIASHVGIYANNRNFADPDRPINQQGITSRGIVIENNCWLGTGVKVLAGVTIGEGSVIGAGSVVTHDIPPYSVAVGVPAKVISHRSRPASATTATERADRQLEVCL
jgi:acetyltransferase-like isoleucine patch superfamily enzyme